MGLKSLLNAATRPSRSPIGIDVGRRAIKAVQLERVKGSGAATGASQATSLAAWRIAAAAILPRPESADRIPSVAEVRQLADALERKSFTGSDVVLAAPEGLLCSVLELPPLPPNAPVLDIARI